MQPLNCSETGVRIERRGERPVRLPTKDLRSVDAKGGNALLPNSPKQTISHDILAAYAEPMMAKPAIKVIWKQP